ncbi:NAD(P)-dependent alcohol dehydrogenase [Neomicrococcus lactis]|uniref:NAD(P)-dependent alcohol dehydrogenase n=1 Tax=Neomicrococcus lactis TaxID=732241 RepID=UPI0023011212|nr:NAD(P)-dependent alcohol dehydrogenase [Neomicrococcus lactis]
MTPQSGRPVPPAMSDIAALRESVNQQASANASAGRTAHAVGMVQTGGQLEKLDIERRAVGPRDIDIEIDFCGLCHSDIHSARGEWGAKELPLVTGHEIVGRVVALGSDVEGFELGERVGVGCLVDSCGQCESCEQGLEQYCLNGAVGTYASTNPKTGEYTQGGYSTSIVVDQNFVLHVPESLDPAAAAPLLCAGITTYSPLNHLFVDQEDAVGVVGLGGLGHMAVKLAKAMGAVVTVFTTSPSKVEAAKELGADHVVLSKDEDAMNAVRGTLDVIIDTVAAPHDLNDYFKTLKVDGALVQVGLPSEAMPAIRPGSLISRRLTYMGSNIGGIAETQEVLDFCAEHGIVSDIEIVTGDQLNEAWERMVAGDVKYRFVLDVNSLREAETAGASA